MAQTRLPETAAFIGFGMSGLAEFCSYVDKATPGSSILIFEKKPNNFATGLPYDIDGAPVWNLNGPPAEKFHIPQDGKSLKEWMEENRSFWKKKFGEAIDEKYPPRPLVGYYLKAQYAHYKEKATAKGIHIIEHFEEEVLRLEMLSDNNFVLTTPKQKVEVNFVGIGFGHLPHDHFQDLVGCPNFFDNPWNINELKKIPKDAEEVLIIGGHLTFIDIVKWLIFVHEFKGKIVSVTRHPSLIIMRDNHEEFPDEPLAELKNQFLNGTKFSLKSAYALFWQTYESVAKHRVPKHPRTSDVLRYQLAKFEGLKQAMSETDNFGNVDKIHAFIEKFFISGCYNAMWKTLSHEDQEEFTKLYYTTIVSYLAGIPPSVARLLMQLYDDKRIEERPGITHLQYDSQHQEYVCKFSNDEEKRTKYVINGTGTGRDISKHYEKFPLLKSLVEDGMITTTQFGGVITNEHNQIINAAGNAVENVVALGPNVFKGAPSPEASFLVAATASHAMEAHFDSTSQRFSR